MILIVIEDLGEGDAVEHEVAVVGRALESEVIRSQVKDISILLVAPEANHTALPDLAGLAQEVVPGIEIEDVGVNLILVVDLDQDLEIGVESTRNLKESIEEEVPVLVLSVAASIQNLAQLEIVKTEIEEEVVRETVEIEIGEPVTKKVENAEVVIEKVENAGVVTEKVEIVEVGTEKVEIVEVKIGVAMIVTGVVKIVVKSEKRKGNCHQSRMKTKPIKLS